jgi:glycosyltransferase involved in cell wall biosynthesis
MERNFKHRFKIVVTFHNVANFISECIDSIKKQKYDNWYCVMVDNGSTDGTYDLLPHGDDRFIIIRNEVRKTPLECDIDAFEYNCEYDEVNVILCGDDKFIGDYVLSTLNRIYCDNNVLLTHGNYIDSNGNLGKQYQYNPYTFQYLRRLGSCCGENCVNCSFPFDMVLGKGGFDFNCSHIKTFKSCLIRELRNQDVEFNCFKINGNWINHSADVFYMTPLMEIAGLHNIYFSETPMYYWRLHENNEVALKIDTDKQPLINLKQSFRNEF